MPTYVAKDINSDLNPALTNTLLYAARELSAGAGIDGSMSNAVPNSSLRSFALFIINGLPNNDAWEDGGTQTVELEVDSGNMNLRARCRINKHSSTGTLIENGVFTSFQTLNASRIFSPVAPTWAGAEACDNRLAIEFEVENIDTMMALTLTIGLGTLANEVITTITENFAGCAVAVNEPELVGIIA